MPRKQRFKPSRKPKPVPPPEVTEIQPTAVQNPTTSSEQGPGGRPPEERGASAEPVDGDGHRA